MLGDKNSKDDDDISCCGNDNDINMIKWWL
jgi:hypothetical protein